MTLVEWIRARLDDLRSMIAPEDSPPDCPPGTGGNVLETPLENGLKWCFSSDTAALAPVRKAVEKFCESVGLDVPAREEVGLVVNEAIANVIRHAYGNAPGKPIELTAERVEGGGLQLKLRDWGNGADPTGRLSRKHDPLTPGGLGLICMKRLMDDARFEKQKTGMLLSLKRVTKGSRLGPYPAGDESL